MFRGSLHCSGGAFLLLSVWSLCFYRLVTFSLPFFGFGHELSFFVFLSSSFLSFSEFHFALCVVNALIKGEIEDQERPSGRWMTAPQ
jgi:hypothetical protein